MTCIHNSYVKCISKVLNVCSKSYNERNELIIAFCIKLVSVVDESASCIKSSASVCRSLLYLERKFSASYIIGVSKYPSVSSVNSIVCNVKVFVKHCYHTLSLSLVVCVSVSLVIVLKEKVADCKKVLYCFCLSCVLLVVCRNNSKRKSYVSVSRGVSTKSVTNYATSKEGDKSIN